MKVLYFYQGEFVTDCDHDHVNNTAGNLVLLKLCTEDIILKDMTLDLKRANKIDKDLDHYYLSVEKRYFCQKMVY